MKTRYTIGITALILAINLFSQCTNSPEKDNADLYEAQETLLESKKEYNEAKTDFAIKYEAFKIESERKIAENEKTITRLKDEAKYKNIETRTQLEIKLMELEKNNELFKVNIENYKENSKIEWESFKTEFNRDMENIKEALQDLSQDNIK